MQEGILIMMSMMVLMLLLKKRKLKIDQHLEISLLLSDECTLYSEGEINIGENSGLLNLEAFGFLLSDMNNQTLSEQLI